jgi:predicted nucleotidyltransferase
MKDQDLALMQIKSFVSEILPGSDIILFGSRARNEILRDSDYDLLIIVKDQFDSSRRLKYQSLIRKNLAIKNILADVIIQSKYDIEKKRNLRGHIVRSALQEGIMI